MRTLSMLVCLFLVIYGFVKAFSSDFVVATILMCIGALALLIIASRSKRIDEHKSTFMDK